MCFPEQKRTSRHAMPLSLQGYAAMMAGYACLQNLPTLCELNPQGTEQQMPGSKSSPSTSQTAGAEQQGLGSRGEQ